MIFILIPPKIRVARIKIKDITIPTSKIIIDFLFFVRMGFALKGTKRPIIASINENTPGNKKLSCLPRSEVSG
jgi:hypothetical protein